MTRQTPQGVKENTVILAENGVEIYGAPERKIVGGVDWSPVLNRVPPKVAQIIDPSQFETAAQAISEGRSYNAAKLEKQGNTDGAKVAFDSFRGASYAFGGFMPLIERRVREISGGKVTLEPISAADANLGIEGWAKYFKMRSETPEGVKESTLVFAQNGFHVYEANIKKALGRRLVGKEPWASFLAEGFDATVAPHVADIYEKVAAAAAGGKSYNVDFFNRQGQTGDAQVLNQTFKWASHNWNQFSDILAQRIQEISRGTVQLIPSSRPQGDVRVFRLIRTAPDGTKQERKLLMSENGIEVVQPPR
jgi:hypothetical protein